MGTRADFYIEKPEGLDWLGSVAYDGYEWCQKFSGETVYTDATELMQADTPANFERAVKDIKKARDDFTSPEEGWPWPWEDSRTTDFAYVLHSLENGWVVRAYQFGCLYDGRRHIDDSGAKETFFPNMKDRQNVQWGKKSGVLIIGG